MNNLSIYITAILQKIRSRQQIRADLKDLENTPFLLNVIAGINKTTSKKQLQRDIKELERVSTIKLNTKIDSKSIRKNLSDATNVTASIDINEKGFKNKVNSLWESTVKRFGMMTILFGGFRVAQSSLSDTLEIDKSLTNLMKVADELESRDALPRYFQRANEIAKSLNVSTNNLINSITEFRKQNFALQDAESLASIATMFANVADTDITTATQSIVSALQAFDTIGNLGESQYNERALAIIDIINEVGNTFSISSEGISVALKDASAAMELAGNDIYQTVSLIAGGNKILQDPAELGNALKTVSMRLRNTKGELQELGYESDGAAESVTKLQTQLLNLTGGKVNILADDESFKSTYDILLEIGNIYDQLNDVNKAEILELIAGKYRGNAVGSILKNIREIPQIYETALNSSGSATAEFLKYQQSAEAAISRFKETWLGIWTDIFSGEDAKNVVNFSTDILNLVDKLSLLKNVLIGLSVYGGGKLFINIFDGLKGVAGNLSNLTKAMSILETGATTKNSIAQLAELTKGLNDNQLKLILSSKALSDQQRLQILQMRGLATAEAQAKLETLGLAKANDVAKVSTIGLKTTLQSLWLTIKANPIMWISLLITAVTSAFSYAKQKAEDYRKTQIEIGEKAAETSSKLADLYSQYSALASITGKTTEQEDKFKDIQQQILPLLETKRSALEGLTAGTDEYTQAVKEATQAELENQRVKITAARISAGEQLEADARFWTGATKSFKMSGEYSPLVRDVLQPYQQMRGGDLGRSLHIAAPDEAKEIIEYYAALQDALKQLDDEFRRTNDEAVLQSKIYHNISDAINEVQPSIEQYLQSKVAEANINYIISNGIPESIEDYNNMKSAIVDLVGANETFESSIISQIENMFPQFINSLNEASEALDDFANPPINDALGDLSDTLNEIASKFAILKAAQEELNGTGNITAATFKKLTENDLLQYLEMVDGELRVSKAALEAQAEAAKITAIKTLKAAMANDILALATGKTEDLSETAKTAIDNLGSGMKDTGSKAQTAAGKLAGFAVAAQAAIDGAQGKLNPEIDLETFKVQANAIKTAYEEIANGIGNISIDGAGTSTGSSSSKKVEEYIAAIDKLYKAEKRLTDIREEQDNLNRKIDLSEDLEEKKRLTLELINLNRDEQAALHEVNEQRRKEIAENLSKLSELGFEYEYDPATNELLILNMERINELTADSAEEQNALRKETEDLIKTVISATDANEEYSKSYMDLEKSIKQARDEQYQLDKQIRKNAINKLEFEADILQGDLNIGGLSRNYEQQLAILTEQMNAALAAGMVEDYQEAYNKIQDVQKKIYDNITLYHETYIRSRNKLDNWQHDSEIAALKRWQAAVENAYRTNLISYEQYVNDMLSLTESMYSAMQAKQQAYVSGVLKQIDKERKNLEEQKKYYEDQKNAYEVSVSTVTKLIDEQIEALKKQNDELNKELQIQQAIENLEKAKNQRTKRVYREGIGYIYEADEVAVAEAQSALDELTRQQQIDAEIAALEAYKQTWIDVVESYQREADKLTTSQILLASWEQDVLSQRTDHIQGFADNYSDICKQLSEDVEGSVASQIADLEDLAQQWNNAISEITDDFSQYEGVLEDLAIFESANYEQRLVLLQDFVANSKAELAELRAEQDALLANEQKINQQLTGKQAGGTGSYTNEAAAASGASAILASSGGAFDSRGGLSLTNENGESVYIGKNIIDNIVSGKDTTSAQAKQALETISKYASQEVLDAFEQAADYYKDTAYQDTSYKNTGDKSSSSGGSSSGGSSSSSSSKTVNVQSDGNAPSGLSVGDKVTTGGGTYEIVEKGTPGSSYNPESGYSSIKVDDDKKKSYDSGGLMDYTGLADIHGTKSRPELALNNADTAKLYHLIHSSPDLVKSMFDTVTQRIGANTLSNLSSVNTTNIIPPAAAPIVNVHMSDINLPNVTDANQFAMQVSMMLENQITQRLSKR